MVAGGAGGGSECGLSLRAPKARWPSVGLYLLTQFPERMPGLTATFLVGGDTTVYYLRVEPGNYDNPPDAVRRLHVRRLSSAISANTFAPRGEDLCGTPFVKVALWL